MRVKKLGVISRNVGGPSKPPLPSQWNAGCRGIASVISAALHYPKRHRYIGHIAAVRTKRVLRMRDRHNAGSTGQAYRWLKGNHAAGVARAHDAAVGLSAE